MKYDNILDDGRLCPNRETCSFIRLNDAFRKTLPQAAKRKSRKLTDHGKQLLPHVPISNVIVLYDKERIMERIAMEEVKRGWGRCKQHIEHVFLSTAAC